MKQVVVHKGRTNILQVSLGFDVSTDVITSEIRAEKDPESDLIAEWTVTFLTDGTDGELVITLDDALTSEITNTIGYMDFKRLSGGEPLSLIDDPLEVLFKDSITV